MIKQGSLVLCQSPYRSTEYSISVVLDPDVGNGLCNIRDILRLDKGKLSRTMNWSNIKEALIKGIIMDISDMDYQADFIDLSPHLEAIHDSLTEIIPEHVI